MEELPSQNSNRTTFRKRLGVFVRGIASIGEGISTFTLFPRVEFPAVKHHDPWAATAEDFNAVGLDMQKSLEDMLRTLPTDEEQMQ